jgi:hypothetical protein
LQSHYGVRRGAGTSVNGCKEGGKIRYKTRGK